jgi:hypothetical protein
MTFCAGLIGGSGNTYAASMLGVALSASEHFSADETDGMVDWPVMAIKASGVRGFRGKGASLLEVARGAFFFENRVSLGQAASTVNTRIFRERAFGDPDQSK